MLKKCPSSKRCRDSNPRPLERESLPITTRPGLPPYQLQVTGKAKRFNLDNQEHIFILENTFNAASFKVK